MKTVFQSEMFQAVVKDAFATPLAAIVSILASLLIATLVWYGVEWGFLHATWPWQDLERCSEQSGICFPFLSEKLRFILFGTYPYEAHWRPALASLLLCGMSAQTGLQMIGRGLRLRPLQIVLGWIVTIALSVLLMAGGGLGLEPVDSIRWNGLPILLILSITAIAGAFPLGMLLALARTQKDYPVLARLSAGYIEIARGVPMLTVLFVGIFVLPLMLPPGTNISPVGATLVALVLFHAAYLAEDIRAGLRSLPVGQAEAAKALGLSYWKTVRFVLAPQAIRQALPSLVNSIIGAYKDTSLVVVLGIHDLTATARMAFSDPTMRPYALEAYVFVGLWFFVSCAFLSYVGRALHEQSKAL